ncbi:MAG: single-stranded DNA-binding protein [Pseudomonadota bacterium]
MMASLNRVTLIGNLGQDPEKRFTPSGQAVATFSIATSERWKDKTTGQNQERTEWHRIVVWGAQAENCAQYLSKGRQVCVEGRLQTRQWEDKDGVKKTTTEIVAQRVLFIGGSGGSTGARTTTTSTTDAGPADDVPTFDAGGTDDVPF